MSKTNEYIIVHHSLVSRDKNPNQFDAIDGFHKRKGWGSIGYHYLIEPDGVVKKGRELSEIGAHTSQKEMNYKSVGICLTGNFDDEDPTEEQKKSLRILIKDLQKKFGIPDEKVKLHRDYAPYKSCPGKRIPDNIIKYLEEALQVPDWATEAVQFVLKNNLFQVKTEEDIRDAVKFHRFYNLLNNE